MPKCKNCYHCEICKKYAIKSGVPETMLDKALGEEFEHLEGHDCYKDKSLIVELPCKIGDTVYIHYVLPNEIKQMKIDGIKVHKEFIQVIFPDNTTFTVWNNDWSDYENTVFRTREDAEKGINND